MSIPIYFATVLVGSATTIVRHASGAEGMSTIATFSASIVALLVAIFAEPIKRLWIGHPGLCVTGKDQPGHEIRLWIENKGRRQAVDTEVLVTSISVLTDGRFLPIGAVTTMNLRWDFLSPDDSRRGDFSKIGIYATISPKVTRYVFLGRMHVTNEKCEFELFTQYRPIGWNNTLSAGEYEIELALGVADYNATRQRLRVTVPSTQDGNVEVTLL